MLIRVTNKGEARTVDFLGVFAKGEVRELTMADIDNYQRMNGVPLASSELSDEDQFDIVFLSEGDTEKKEGN